MHRPRAAAAQVGCIDDSPAERSTRRWHTGGWALGLFSPSVNGKLVATMRLRDFLKAGHTPSLVCAFLYFDTSFMVWVLLGALANSIVPDFGLSESQRGLMLAIPLLGGAILRLVLGLMTDHIGA